MHVERGKLKRHRQELGDSKGRRIRSGRQKEQDATRVDSRGARARSGNPKEGGWGGGSKGYAEFVETRHGDMEKE